MTVAFTRTKNSQNEAATEAAKCKATYMLPPTICALRTFITPVVKYDERCSGVIQRGLRSNFQLTKWLILYSKPSEGDRVGDYRDTNKMPSSI